MKFGVVVFPGSNCDHDTYHVISKVIGQPVDFIWHRQNSVGDCDAIMLPGGFSYGDYLRTGAIARFSPVMGAVKEFASRGGIVLGICNGFQILCEAGLLPGALLRNANLKFICGHVNIASRTRTRRSHRAAGEGRCCRSRSLTATAITTATPRHWPNFRARTGSSSVTDADGELTTMRIPTDRSTTSPASAIASETFSA